MRTQPRVLGIVLAGGEGKRLWPLTADRAKPAVPFGGSYRLIDFVLSNLVNAGYLRFCVLTQYKSHSLDRHITTTWRMTTELGNYVTPVPAQQRLGPRWFTGSADAIYQSLNLVYDDQPDHIVVFGADHVYRMDPSQMVEQHIESGAGLTVAGIRVPRPEASAFGVIDADEKGKIRQFLEKPSDPPGLPDRPDETFASMGNYVFETGALLEALKADAADDSSVHDMGGSIMPMLVDRRAGPRLRLRRQRRAGRDRPRPRLLAGRRDAGRLLRRAHGPGRRPPDLQPVQPAAGRSSPPTRSSRRRSSSRAGRRRSPSSATARSSPTPRSVSRSSRRGSGSTPVPTSRAAWS